MWLTRRSKQHDNVHIFGCGVEFDHFGKAAGPEHAIPPDIDFMSRPILGWFGVVDERVDYAMVGEMARMRPDWSFAMVGPVVKVDPNLLPHSPNLFWLGGRDYQQLPNYCARVRRLHDGLRDERGDAVHQPDQGPGIHGDRQADRSARR